ncbi:hypothetical protein EV126DRAFT_409220 [Verticillium dahliae]|nr:hypothetical protein EV126DRAFT_409220 [Verticillium dahliae]
MYSDESVYDFTQPFGDRAERLWTCVKSLDTLSNLAVAQLLSLAFLGHGKDYFVLICLAQSSRMATRLYLFGVEPCTALEKIKKIPQDTCSTSCYADGGSLTGLCEFIHPLQQFLGNVSSTALTVTVLYLLCHDIVLSMASRRHVVMLHFMAVNTVT